MTQTCLDFVSSLCHRESFLRRDPRRLLTGSTHDIPGPAILTGMVTEADVITAVLLASAAFGGLILVFLGIVMTSTAFTRMVWWGYQAVIGAVIFDLWFSLVCVGLSTWWLIDRGTSGGVLYPVSLPFFFLQLCLLFLLTLLMIVLTQLRPPD